MSGKVEIDWGDSRPVQAKKSPIEIDWGADDSQVPSINTIPQKDRMELMQQEHPYIYKAAQYAAEHPALRKSLEAVSPFTHAVVRGTEHIGLPSLGQGLFNAPITFARRLANLAPNVNLPPVATEAPLDYKANPMVKDLMHATGNALGFSPFTRAVTAPIGLLKDMANDLSYDQRLQKAQEAYDKATSNQAKNKAQAKTDFGYSTPEYIETNIPLKADKLRESILRMNEIAPPNQHGPNLPASEAKRLATESSNAIQEYGGMGQNFPVRLANAFKTRLRGEVNPETERRENGFMQRMGEPYNQLTEELRDKNIQLKNAPTEKEALEAIRSAKVGGKSIYDLMSDSMKAQALEKFIQEGTTSQNLNAADALTQYRELKRQAFNARDNAFRPHVTPEESLRWQNKGKFIQDNADKIKSILENNLKGGYLEKLKKIDEKYSEYVAPLHDNDVYKKIMRGQAGKTTLQDMSSDAPGNLTLRMMTSMDPEIQRLLFGQNFADKPTQLLKSNELADWLSTFNPKIKDLIAEQKAHHEQLPQRVELDTLSNEIRSLETQIDKGEKHYSTLKQGSREQKEAKQKLDQLKNKKKSKDQRKDKLTKYLSRAYGVSKIYDLFGF